jgi:D-alanyl-D-alanine carboxypeptidase
VVLGGKTAAGRDRIMAGLIEDHLDSAAPGKSTMVADAAPTEATPVKVEAKLAPMATAYAAPAPTPVVAVPAEKARPTAAASQARGEDRTASIPAAKTEKAATTKVAAVAPAMRAPEKQMTTLAKATPAKAEPARPSAAMSGMMIQIGASDEMSKANDLLAKARGKAPTLSGATSFTEKVKTGSGTLYRARFAGLTESRAEAACKSLKRSGFACFTTKN